MLGYPSVEEIKTAAEHWAFLAELPDSIGGFSKKRIIEEKGNNILLCSFENREVRAKADIIYSKETFDYILVRAMGLNEYRDIRFIYKDRENFERELGTKFSGILAEMAEPERRGQLYIVKNKGISTWNFQEILPERIGDFELYINPSAPVNHLNGSVIFIDYSDFQRRNQLVFLYNILRDEIFAEAKLNGMFITLRDFDCRTLPELEKKLRSGLKAKLAELAAGNL